MNQVLSDAAEAALVESLASVMQSLDRVDDEDLDEYLATNLMEYVCYRLNQLSKQDRHAVATRSSSSACTCCSSWRWRPGESMSPG